MIRCKGLQKKFGKKKVLDSLDLDIPSGCVTALIGPSGAGKSVLSKTIAGLIEPDGGIVEINGEVGNDRGDRTFDRVSYVFQFGGLLDFLTLFENILFPLKRRGSYTKENIQFAFSLAERLGVARYLDRRPKEVPLAVRKLAALLRALMTRSEWIFVDEPDSGLDPETISRLYSVIRQFKDERNIVIVSHDVPAVFEICDFYAMIYDGKIVSSGWLKMAGKLEAKESRADFGDEERPGVSTGFNRKMIESKDEFIQQFLDGRSDGPIRLG